MITQIVEQATGFIPAVNIHGRMVPGVAVMVDKARPQSGAAIDFAGILLVIMGGLFVRRYAFAVLQFFEAVI